jgi:hypothetical protein
MSRGEAYNSLPNIIGSRGRAQLPQVDRSPSRDYRDRGSPLGKHFIFRQKENHSLTHQNKNHPTTTQIHSRTMNMNE